MLYEGMSNDTAEFVWIQFLNLVNLPIPSFLCDSIIATYLAANPIFHNCFKHIEIDHHFICERVVC